MSSNPYDFQNKPSTPPPALQQGSAQPSLGRFGQDGSLGSLAQAAREKSLGKAKGWLIAVGVLIILGTLVMIVLLPEQIEAELWQDRLQGTMSPAQLQQKQTSLFALNYMLEFGQFVVGVAFIVFGTLMKRYPVAMSVSAMSIFVLHQILVTLVNPLNLLGGLLIKIILVVVLINAIKAAFAYERERQLAVDYAPDR